VILNQNIQFYRTQAQFNCKETISYLSKT